MGAMTWLGLNVGGANWLWNADQTHITLFMFGIFILLTLFIGWLTMTQDHHHSNKMLHIREQYIDCCWFVSDALMRLGIITTVLGFILMFTGKMRGLDLSNIQNVRDLVVQISTGLTTALTGTLVGVVTSMLSGAQLKNYELGMTEK